MNLADWIQEEFKRPDSALSEFLELFTIEFIFDHLNSQDRKIFLAKVAAKDEGAIDFACHQIPDFEEKFVQSFQKKVLEILWLEEDL